MSKKRDRVLLLREAVKKALRQMGPEGQGPWGCEDCTAATSTLKDAITLDDRLRSESQP